MSDSPKTDRFRSNKLKSPAIDRLFTGIMQLKTLDECYTFFDDVCTIQEIYAMSQRLEVAGLLSDGKTYIDIVDSTGASTATISRVSRCLARGDGGYQTVLSRLNESAPMQDQ